MIGARIASVQQRVVAACVKHGRNPASVGLIAVSKTFPASAIAAAYDAGQRHFGESYAQELRDKGPALAADIRWHYIGRLQSNKAKYIAPYAHRVHSITSVGHAEALASRATSRLAVLVHVNLANEPTKDGVSTVETLNLCASITALPNIELVGLMALPPFTPDPADSAPWFAELAALAARGRAIGLPLHELSMGMSHDFEVAIAHGATWVRVGTAIFGGRA